jgi:hypothetical protein
MTARRNSMRAFHLSGRWVTRELSALIRIYGKPGCIVSDNVLAREQNAV